MSFTVNALTKSLNVFHLAGSACNNCDIEILDALTPKYDLERFGITLVGSVRHADVLLLSGVFNKKARTRMLELLSLVDGSDTLEEMNSTDVARAVKMGELDQPQEFYSALKSHVLQKIDWASSAADLVVRGCKRRHQWSGRDAYRIVGI